MSAHPVEKHTLGTLIQPKGCDKAQEETNIVIIYGSAIRTCAISDNTQLT